LSGRRASSNDVALAIQNVALTPNVILVVLKLTNVSSGVRVCDVGLDANTFATSDTHLIDVSGSCEGIYFWVDQWYTIGVIGHSNYPLTTGLSPSSSAATFSESLRHGRLRLHLLHSIPG
jgi:hypothetical protein